MHIVVNTRLLICNKLDGIGWFSHEVLSRLTKALPEHRFTFLFDRPFDEKFIYNENVNGITLFPPTRHPLLYTYYFEYSIPRFLHRAKADLFFSPDGFLTTRTNVPQIPVIHDLNFEHRPQDLPWAYRRYYRHYFPKFAANANEIITVSEFSKMDIHRTYHVELDRIHVAHNGFNPAFQPLSEEQKSTTKQRYSNGSPYFIFVGNFSYRKNIHGIINAYERYRSSGGQSKLVLVGNPLWKYTEMNDALEQSTFKSDIVFPGHLDIESLKLVVGSASAMLFPSYFEGFGIPVLEAFAANTPVITSNHGALKEVAGDAALFADPDDVQMLCQHMKLVETNANERQSLIEKGISRSRQFSWEQTSNKVKSILLQSLD